MTGYYATNLTANSVDLTTTDLRLMFRLIDGGPWMNWETRGVDVTIDQSPGQVPYPRERHRLLIVARGMIHGSGSTEAAQREDLADIMATLKALMDPTLDPYTLTHVDEGGTTWTISARPLDRNPEYGDDDIPSRREVTLSWLAIGDDWAEGA